MRAQQIAHAPGAVADRVALVRRRHPLVDDHRRVRQRLVDRRAIEPQLFELLRGVELLPEIEGDRRLRRARARRGSGRRTRAACRRSPSPAGDRRRRAARRRSRPAAPRSTRSRPSAPPRASDPCRRTARRRRPSSPAPRSPRRRAPAPACRTPRRAARRSLRARWRTGTDRRPRRTRPAPRRRRGRRNGRAKRRASPTSWCSDAEVALEPALRADDQQPRPRVERRVVGVEEADQILDLLVGDHPADEQDVGPVVVELLARPASSASRSRCEKSGTTGSTAVRGNPSASRSCRLNSESPSARSQRSA